MNKIIPSDVYPWLLRQNNIRYLVTDWIEIGRLQVPHSSYARYIYMNYCLFLDDTLACFGVDVTNLNPSPELIWTNRTLFIYDSCTKKVVVKSEKRVKRHSKSRGSAPSAPPRTRPSTSVQEKMRTSWFFANNVSVPVFSNSRNCDVDQKGRRLLSVLFYS